MPEGDGDDYIATRDAAQLLGVHVATVNRWAGAGILVPAVELPGRTGARLFLRSDVERLRRERVT